MFELRSKTKWYCPAGKWFYGPTPLPSGISWASGPPTPLEFPIPSMVGVWIFSGTTQWTPHIPLMNQNFIQKYGQIIGSWLFLNWICLIVTIFLEFFADGSSQRKLFRNNRVLECQISNRFQFFSAQIYDDQFRFIMKRAERFNATTRVNNYHFSFGAWTFK